MKSTLRNLVLAAAAVAVPFVTSAAMASTVNVPFAFTVAGKVCPAGKYQVARTGISGNVVTLRSNDSANTFSFVLRPGDPNPNDTRVVLSFAAAGAAGHSLNSLQYGADISYKLDKTLSNERLAELPMTILQGQ